MPKRVNHNERRAEYYEAVYRLVKMGGFANATARAIAKEAGYTTGALKPYVKCIDELLVQCVTEVMESLRQKVEKATSECPTKIEALRQAVYLTLCADEDQQGNWNFFLSCWERSAYNENIRLLTHAAYSRWLTRIGGLIRDAAQRGEIEESVDVEQAAQACVALLDGIGTQVLRSGTPLSPEAQKRLVDTWITLWLRPKRNQA